MNIHDSTSVFTYPVLDRELNLIYNTLYYILISFYLTLTGSYKGCGNTYETNVEADHVLNPVNPIPIEPFQASHGLSVSVQGPLDSNAQYTLVMQDAGFFPLRGLFINIPGNNFTISNGQVRMEVFFNQINVFVQ